MPLRLTYEELIARPEVKGIHVGICVGGFAEWDDEPDIEGRPSFEQAHSHLKGAYAGHICVRWPWKLMRGGSKHWVSPTLLHELCHLQLGYQGHVWRGSYQEHPPRFWRLLKREYGLSR